MTPGRIACALAVMAVFCVLGVFFFPSISGPYSAVHGPVTALLSIRAAASLRFRIVRAGLNAVRGLLTAAGLFVVPFAWAAFHQTELQGNGMSVGSASVLRC
ncbi:MAG TPA: hypothetical protein VGS27_33110 [Candidatus Sulfotelmatobacter sp.]|nr:hypothetical protein [Candidatus Sulfotelmatobacter sp.]